MNQISRAVLAAKIDSTLLRPGATASQIDLLCDQAVQCGFFSVCVSLFRLPQVVKRLSDACSRVKAVTVLGFPTGAVPTAMKVAEARWAVEHGADELDMVINLGALLDGQSQYVRDDIAAVADIAHRASSPLILKVILETAALNTEQKILACQLTASAGADFVKTSTGTHPAGGATVEDVALLAANSPGLKVKAAGGIKDLPTTLAMIDAGADRIGTSSGLAIIEQLG